MIKLVRMPEGVHLGGKVKIAVVLDKKVFDDICAFGINHGMSFSEAINDLAACGVFDMHEAGEFHTAALPAVSPKGDSNTDLIGD